MAPASNSSLSSTSHSHLDNRLDFASIRSLVSLVDRHIHRFLSDPAARKSLRLKSSSKLTISNNGCFEFSEHSVLSNLYWGFESIELAIESSSQEERSSRLANSEKMLQIPALLEEDGSTAGIENRYIVCCTYFYLSLVRKLRRDEWQMTMHFLQSVLVFPQLVRRELAPGLWRSLFGSLVAIGDTEEAVDEAAKQQGRRYKDWLMYYQVVSYGETPPWIKECSFQQYKNFASMKCLDSPEQVPTWLSFQVAQMVYPPHTKEIIEEEKNKAPTTNSEECEDFTKPKIVKSLMTNLDEGFHEEIKERFDIRCLQDMLEESQSDSSVSFYSHIDSTEASDSEMRMQGKENPEKTLSTNADLSAFNNSGRNYIPGYSLPRCPETSAPYSTSYSMQVEACEANPSCLLSSRSHSSFNNLRFSILDLRDVETCPFSGCSVEDGTPPERSPPRDLRCFSNFSSKFRRKYSISELVSRGSFARRKINFSNSEKDWSDESSSYGKDNRTEPLGRFEKADSTLCFSQGLGKCEDADLEVTTIWELLNTKKEVRYSSAKQEMLDQLLDIISTSKKEKVIRASVSMLLLLISEDKAVIEDIKKKDLHLNNLASALKKNVQEAAILIYLLNPSPTEMKGLELLPALVEIACNSNGQKGSSSLPLTPTSASIAMIEVLVTAFDYVTNNMHLAAISSPHILSKLVNVAMNKNLEEGVVLAAILVRCMRLNGNCKKFLSQVTPVDPFLHLLRSNERRAKLAALEYFHEILCMPRSAAIHLLHQIREQGSIGIMHTLMACVQQTELEHRLLAANLLVQLDILEHPSGKTVFKEEAMEVLLESVASEENYSTQTLAAFILSNLGGTYSWRGEPYTAAWLVKKAGLTSVHHRNMIRKVDWFDPCLQDTETNAWSAKTARGVIKFGHSLFNALARGIQSKIKNVSHDCLICIAWLGSEMAVMGPSSLRYYACEILLSEMARFLHPGSGLDERILACLCMYNYTSGKGKQKLMNFSEGSRESLRRLSGYTWMAEELLQVTDYFIPTKPRVSCVHTQILEVGHVGSGAATALIFYKGQLCAGYSDGSIKVWDIKGQRTMLVLEAKEHRRPVTCFALFEPGDSLLSGSSDKTVRVWKMVQRKLECVEVIEMKDPIQKLDSCGDKILVVTQSRGLKGRLVVISTSKEALLFFFWQLLESSGRVCHESRSIQTTCEKKHVKCLTVVQGKIYLGCSDSSIQEVDIMENNKTEVRPPIKRWRMQNKPVNSIVVYKGWVYSAGAVLEGSSIKEWRKHCQPQISIAMERGTSVQAMSLVEDFIYLNCSSSPSIIQVWLRGMQRKVGRLSAGSKITSLLTANDIIFCGIETGLIKGWIPL